MNFRQQAITEISKRTFSKFDIPEKKTSDYFASEVFTRKKMQEYLSKEAYENIISAIDYGKKINRRISNQIALGMKAWALEKGVTHYTHWFHPLNGATAEKHDSFFEPTNDGGAIERFDGDMLIQQEPDASSFPNGGIRNTFEARGYTAWDPSSPAFIMGKTLCIPTIFISYTGEALDYKTPLLKALNLLDTEATKTCNLFDKNVTKVISTLGWEQEYFLIDKALYLSRPDLVLAGRTLMGHASAKDQQLEDHYFGSIPDRVANFMREFEYEALKLGIPVKTRHNEVAPNQYECAPVFEETNLAVDHNQLIMELISKIANKHNLKALFHEKPFAGINGSGKHNNWSLMTNTGVNLLKPGKNPKSNLQFLTFLVNTIKAVYDNADILRASIVSPGNEYRLGASEAPPSIISVFLGKHLTDVLNDIEKKVTDTKMTPETKTELKLNIGKIPEILLDNTDRNRTSPFAFTGNRFEFRAVGSSANCAAPMITLNTAVANQLKIFNNKVNELISKGIKKDEAIFNILKEIIIESKKIRFEGNGYGQEWINKARKIGLSNIKEMPDAIKAYISKESIKLFVDNKIFTKRELEARYEIRQEIYIKKIQIESRTLGDLAINHIIPIALKYQNLLVNNVQGLKNILSDTEFQETAISQIESIKKISKHIHEIRILVKEMVNNRKVANSSKNLSDKIEKYKNNVKPYLEKIRYNIDKLELIVDNEIWPLPKYRELLFLL